MKMKGKLKRECFKPLLMEKKKVQHVSWCERLKGMTLLHRKFYACWIDEKFFYISSGWSKEKHLPLATFEMEQDVQIPASPAACYRRFMVKVMLMGVIAHPVNPLIRFLRPFLQTWLDGW